MSLGRQRSEPNVTVTRLEVRQPAPGPGRPQRSQQPKRPQQAQRPQQAGPRQREREAAVPPVPPVPPAKPLSRTARRAAAEDAKLLAAIRVLFSHPSLFPRFLFLAFGFAAITSLGVALAGAVPLPYGFHYAVIPAYTAMLLIGLRYPAWGKRALIGLVAGMIATGVYDILRLGLMLAGLWGDPIPSIGQLALNDPNAEWYWGYVWRFVGNGGGMGLAFAMLPWRGVKLGIAYGSAVCTGLVVLLYFWPVAQQHFFALTPATAAGGMAGHGAIAGGPDLVLPGGRLSSDELYAVKCALQQQPRAHGFASDNWTLRRVAPGGERATRVRGWQPAELLGPLEALELDLHLRGQHDQGREPATPRAARTTMVS